MGYILMWAYCYVWVICMPFSWLHCSPPCCVAYSIERDFLKCFANLSGASKYPFVLLKNNLVDKNQNFGGLDLGITM
jgi:hypothetical protein